MLQVLTKAPGTSDAADIHRTVMAMTSQPLRQRLLSVAAGNDLFSPIIDVFAQLDPFALSLDASATEVTTWKQSSGGFLGMLQHTITEKFRPVGEISLDNIVVTAPPPDIVAVLLVASQVCGTAAVVQCLVQMLVQYSSNQTFHILLDLISTIVCVHDDVVAGPSLRDAVRLQHSNLGKFLKKKRSLDAQALVHLHRRVNAYSSALSPRNIGLSQPDFVPLHNIAMANADLDAPQAQPDMDILQTELPEAQDIDQALDATATMGNLDQDGGTSLDDMYGLQNDNMGFDNLEDFDIDDMF